MKILHSYGEIETQNISRELGQMAKAGEVYCLCGDLGTGKTAFAKGFAEGLDIREDIVSPTFTIVHEYMGRLPLFQFDVYRILDGDALYDIGFDDYLDRGGVCLIEWANQLREDMPEDAIWIEIEKELSLGENYRKITITGGVEE